MESTITYPLVDGYGCVWIDPSGFLERNGNSESCFICNRKTNRIDIDYHGYFCDSYACNLTIDRNLKGESKYVNTTET